MVRSGGDWCWIDCEVFLVDMKESGVIRWSFVLVKFDVGMLMVWQRKAGRGERERERKW